MNLVAFILLAHVDIMCAEEFLFSEAPTLKPMIIIVILQTDQPKKILPTACQEISNLCLDILGISINMIGICLTY